MLYIKLIINILSQGKISILGGGGQLDKVRIGILGVGGIAGRHIEKLMAIEKAVITSVCDVNAESSQKAADKIGAKVFVDYKKMVDSGEIDALFVCLPPFAHCGQIEYAASKGIHIFTEKPLSLTVERAKSIVDAVEKYKVINQIGYHNRYGTAVRKLKAMIEDGSAGKPTLFDGQYACNSLHVSWWRDKDKSGGQIFEQIIHTYDLSLYLLGAPVMVAAFKDNLCHINVDGYTAEDTSTAIIRFNSGALGTVAATNNAIPGKWINTYTVVCEKVTVNFNDSNNAEFIFTDKELENGGYRVEHVNEVLDMYTLEDNGFINDVLNGSQSFVPIREGLKGIYLVDAVRASANKNGELVICSNDSNYSTGDIDS